MEEVSFLNKRILFIGPIFYDYHNLILDKVKEWGAKPIFFPERRYGLLYRLLNTISPKLIFLYQDIYYSVIWLLVFKKKVDIFFLIRGYKIPLWFLEKLRKKNPEAKFIMYQWDSNRNNKFDHLIDKFDSSFSFDYEDCQTYSKLNHLNLFYTQDIVQIRNEGSIDGSYFLFGSFSLQRYHDFKKIKHYCEQNRKSIIHFLYIPYTTYIKFKYLYQIDIDKDFISFRKMKREQYLAYLKESSIIIDISDKNQSGLAMRVIEAFGAGKKIWTTNKSILQDPIYTPNWVQCLEIENIRLPQYLVNSFNTEIVYDKLYFDNWLTRLFS